jgi:hypothetical protein
VLLGLSGLQNEDTIAFGVVGGSDHGDGGVTDGALLTRFADAVHAAAGRAGTDPDTAAALAAARAEVAGAVGPDGLVDAAAVCANFAMMVRIADGTGTPLDEGTVEVSTDLWAELDLDGLTSRRLVEP